MFYNLGQFSGHNFRKRFREKVFYFETITSKKTNVNAFYCIVVIEKEKINSCC